jgi:AcrR family transcriptional regulator
MIISFRDDALVGLREEHRELTRQKILTSVLDLLADGSLDELSVPAVSRHSGVSVATIYRYFPNRDELLAAASAEPSRRAMSSSQHPPRDGDDAFAHFLRTMWLDFSTNLPLLRHQITSEPGREMRRARLDQSRERLAEYVTAFGVDAGSPEGERLISMLMLVAGSVALIELHDRQGISVDDSIDQALWATRALIDATVDAPSTHHQTATT